MLILFIAKIKYLFEIHFQKGYTMQGKDIVKHIIDNNLLEAEFGYSLDKNDSPDDYAGFEEFDTTFLDSDNLVLFKNN
jgi:hypothetical protein